MGVPRFRAKAKPGSARRKPAGGGLIPNDVASATVSVDGHEVQLTNLQKLFWPDAGISKGDLLRYYADVSTVLLPHLLDRAMVMKRYPNGAGGDFFFQKRAPSSRPDWIRICLIEHSSGNIVDFPVVDDLASLLWVVNLGCIDMNQWYARCDDTDRPDYVHFDLDPVEGTPFEQVCETALVVHDALEALKMPNFAKTTGSRGIHVYVPIVRGPVQREVWGFAKEFSHGVAKLQPKLITTEYRVAKRPRGHVLVDYNQNAWGRTLASVYSVRPKPRAPVSTPVTWEEVREGIEIEDFRLDNVRPRIAEQGDLWEPLLNPKNRFDLKKVM
jgi:bifunctional non-homologous end joining protein LigD